MLHTVSARAPVFPYLRLTKKNEQATDVPEARPDDPLKLLRENGPWVYELFAVLIHSGSALGGHYYAHIKSLGDDGDTLSLRTEPTATALVEAHCVQNVRLVFVLFQAKEIDST